MSGWNSEDAPNIKYRLKQYPPETAEQMMALITEVHRVTISARDELASMRSRDQITKTSVIAKELKLRAQRLIQLQRPIVEETAKLMEVAATYKPPKKGLAKKGLGQAASTPVSGRLTAEFVRLQNKNRWTEQEQVDNKDIVTQNVTPACKPVPDYSRYLFPVCCPKQFSVPATEIPTPTHMTEQQSGGGTVNYAPRGVAPVQNFPQGFLQHSTVPVQNRIQQSPQRFIQHSTVPVQNRIQQSPQRFIQHSTVPVQNRIQQSPVQNFPPPMRTPPKLNSQQQQQLGLLLRAKTEPQVVTEVTQRKSTRTRKVPVRLGENVTRPPVKQKKQKTATEPATELWNSSDSDIVELTVPNPSGN